MYALKSIIPIFAFFFLIHYTNANDYVSEREWNFSETEVVLSHPSLIERNKFTYALCQHSWNNGSLICQVYVETMKFNSKHQEICTTALHPEKATSRIEMEKTLYWTDDKILFVWFDSEKDVSESSWSFIKIRLIDIKDCSIKDISIVTNLSKIFFIDYSIKIVPHVDTFDVFYLNMKKPTKYNRFIYKQTYHQNGTLISEPMQFPDDSFAGFIETTERISEIPSKSLFSVMNRIMAVYPSDPEKGYFLISPMMADECIIASLTPNGECRMTPNSGKKIFRLFESEGYPSDASSGYGTFVFLSESGDSTSVRCFQLNETLNVVHNVRLPIGNHVYVMSFIISSNEFLVLTVSNFEDQFKETYRLWKINANGRHSKAILLEPIENPPFEIYTKSVQLSYTDQNLCLTWFFTNRVKTRVKAYTRCVYKKAFDENIHITNN